jgi:hypothetical protein
MFLPILQFEFQIFECEFFWIYQTINLAFRDDQITEHLIGRSQLPNFRVKR